MGRSVRLIAALALAAMGIVAGGCGESFQQGAELEVEVEPAGVSFGSVAVGDTQTLKVRVRHTGARGVLKLGEARLQLGSDELSVDGPERLELGPGEETVFTVTYAPRDGEYDSGVIVLPNDVPERGDVVVPVDTVLQVPLLGARPGALDFGSVSAGGEASGEIVIENQGWIGDTITGLGLDHLAGGEAFEIVEAPDLPLALDIGETFTVRIRYAPDVTGSDVLHQAHLRLVTAHPETTHRVVPVRGHARHSQLTIEPGAVGFGWVPVGETEIRDVVVHNGGSEVVTIETLALVLEDGAADLTVLGAPETPFTMAPGEVLTLTVRFAPKIELTPPAGRLGVLRLVSDDYQSSEREVPITGQAGVPALRFVPDEVADLGVVAVLHGHRRTVKAINDGPIPLAITGASLGEQSAEGFEVVDAPLPVTLAPGGAAELRVGYTNPGIADGLSWGQLVVSSDDPVQPQATLNLRARNAALPDCIPRFTPPVLDFGTLAAGQTSTETLTLVNDGSLPCVYQAAAFRDCSLPFGLCQPTAGLSQAFGLGDGSPPQGRQLFYGDALHIPVRYSPSGTIGEHAGIPVVTVERGIETGLLTQYHGPTGGVPPALRGVVGTAGVRAVPDVVDFALTTQTCATDPVTIEVTRVGAQPIDLAAIEPGGGCSGFEVTAPSLPVPLYQSEAEAPVLLEARFVPDAPGDHHCTLSLVSDLDDGEPATVTLSGSAAPGAARTDSFVQEPEMAVDILFVVDSSGSMDDEQDALVDGFDGFVAQAATWDVHYQIGVVTTDLGDAGILVGVPYVTNESTEAFAENALVGTHGSGDERGLQTAWMALQPAMLLDHTTACSYDGQCQNIFPGSKCVLGGCGGPNRGFLREKALLAIIWISDEQEHSCDVPVDTYVEFFKALKPPGFVKGYAIVGDPKTEVDPLGGCGGGGSECDGCTGCPFFGGPGGPNQGAEAGGRYVEAALALGGSWFSICSFGDEAAGQPPLLEQIGKDAFKPVSVFPLTEPPVPGSVSVQVDGQACEAGWSYDPGLNQVEFTTGSPCFPGPSATVDVHYEALCQLP